MLKGNKRATIRFKTQDIDLSNIAFGILQDENANLVELFRLEGRKQPIVRKRMFDEYSDTIFHQILNMWNMQKKTYEALPKIEDIDSSLFLDAAANLRIFRADDAFVYREYSMYDYLECGLFRKPKVDLLSVLCRSKSVVALLYYSMIYATSISHTPLHSVHFAKNKDGYQEPWLSMVLPFGSVNKNGINSYLMLQKRI